MYLLPARDHEVDHNTVLKNCSIHSTKPKRVEQLGPLSVLGYSKFKAVKADHVSRVCGHYPKQTSIDPGFGMLVCN